MALFRGSSLIAHAKVIGHPPHKHLSPCPFSSTYENFESKWKTLFAWMEWLSVFKDDWIFWSCASGALGVRSCRCRPFSSDMTMIDAAAGLFSILNLNLLTLHPGWLRVSECWGELFVRGTCLCQQVQALKIRRWASECLDNVQRGQGTDQVHSSLPKDTIRVIHGEGEVYMGIIRLVAFQEEEQAGLIWKLNRTVEYMGKAYICCTSLCSAMKFRANVLGLSCQREDVLSCGNFCGIRLKVSEWNFVQVTLH